VPRFAISAIQCDHQHSREHCQYQVAWSINPHMSIGSVDFTLAAAEHHAFVTALGASGALLEQIPFVHGAYDSVFVKDTALLLASRGRNRALLAHFKHAERRPERAARARHYEEQGYAIVADDHPHQWEGGDLVKLPSHEGLFLGHGFRSEYRAAAWLERHTGGPVCPIELVDPHLYHLDMVLAILPDGTALVCSSALAPHSLRVLEQVRGLRRVVVVGPESAHHFALNLVAVGNTVVLGAHDDHIESIVTSLGYRCIVVPLSQFQLAGGSAACLVAPVHRDPLG
jgi:N-dimethylarginine dimethylaminohydrolase